MNRAIAAIIIALLLSGCATLREDGSRTIYGHILGITSPWHTPQEEGAE
jgi:uncharacterized protein YceK